MMPPAPTRHDSSGSPVSPRSAVPDVAVFSAKAYDRQGWVMHCSSFSKNLAPGYRWLRLHDDGRLETGISRVTGFEFEVDLSGEGY